IPRVLINRLLARSDQRGPPQLAGWPNVAVRFKMLIKRRVWSNPRAWTILDARGRSPHVRSSSQPIVRPRSRGSLPRLPYAASVGGALTCQRARGALAHSRPPPTCWTGPRLASRMTPGGEAGGGVDYRR